MQHGLSDEKMRTLYQEDDWVQFSTKDPSYLHVRDWQIPYAVFENEDDVTTNGGSELGNRLESTFQYLWEIWNQSRELS
jgi:hypothetical protein